MNILEVVEACGAGVGRHVRTLCQDLVAQGHQVTVAYSPHRTDEAFRRFVVDQQDMIRFVALEIGRNVSPLSDLRGIVQVSRLIRRGGPFDVVHGHSSKGGAVARIAGTCIGVPTVYTPHSLVMASPEISKVAGAVYTWIERLLGHWATSRIIAVSEDERKFVLQLSLVPQDRVMVIENGIDDQDFEYFSEVDRKDVGQKPITFGSIMRFSPQKAPGRLVEAFEQLVEMSPQVSVQLVIAGDGELFDEVKRQVEVTGLGERISLLGWREDTRATLRGFDAFVLSSLYEGFPYTLLEAMAAKLPIVAADVFGTRETVAQVPGNVLVPVKDLAYGMKRMITPTGCESVRSALQRIGQANYDYVRARFKRSETTRRTLEVYETLS